MSANGALGAAIGSAVFSLMGKLLFPEVPFMDRVAIVFFLCLFTAVVISLGKKGISDKGALIDGSFLEQPTSSSFNLMSCLVVLIVGGFYYAWW